MAAVDASEVTLYPVRDPRLPAHLESSRRYGFRCWTCGLAEARPLTLDEVDAQATAHRSTCRGPLRNPRGEVEAAHPLAQVEGAA